MQPLHPNIRNVILCSGLTTDNINDLTDSQIREKFSLFDLSSPETENMFNILIRLLVIYENKNYKLLPKAITSELRDDVIDKDIYSIFSDIYIDDDNEVVDFELKTKKYNILHKLFARCLIYVKFLDYFGNVSSYPVIDFNRVAKNIIDARNFRLDTSVRIEPLTRMLNEYHRMFYDFFISCKIIKNIHHIEHDDIYNFLGSPSIKIDLLLEFYNYLIDEYNTLQEKIQNIQDEQDIDEFEMFDHPCKYISMCIWEEMKILHSLICSYKKNIISCKIEEINKDCISNLLLLIDLLDFPEHLTEFLIYSVIYKTLNENKDEKDIIIDTILSNLILSLKSKICKDINVYILVEKCFKTLFDTNLNV